MSSSSLLLSCLLFLCCQSLKSLKQVITVPVTLGFSSAPSRVGAAAVGLKALRSHSKRTDWDGPTCASDHLARGTSLSFQGIKSESKSELSNSSIDIIDIKTSYRAVESRHNAPLTADVISEIDSCDRGSVPVYANNIKFSVSLPQERYQEPVPRQESKSPLSISSSVWSQDPKRFIQKIKNEHDSEEPASCGMLDDTVPVVAKQKQKHGIGRVSRSTSSSLASLPAPAPRSADYFSIQNTDYRRKNEAFSSFVKKAEDNDSNPCEITRMTNHDFLQQPQLRGKDTGQTNLVMHNYSVSPTIRKRHFNREEYSVNHLFPSVKKIKDNTDVT